MCYLRWNSGLPYEFAVVQLWFNVRKLRLLEVMLVLVEEDEALDNCLRLLAN